MRTRSPHSAAVSWRSDVAAADLNAKAAENELLIHVTPAHHRLSRIAEKTGRVLRRLSDVIDC
jgi:sugar diacid utilization regulator